jgi:two-component system chemotaxis response regulator CheB
MSDSAEKPVNVLVVDDDPVFRRILVHTFSKIPAANVVAAVGTLAEAQAALNKGGIRLVTLDVVMKGESGLGLLPWMTAHHPKAIAVLLTAGQEKRASQAIDAVLLGAVALILKPAGPDAPAQLATQLSRLVASTGAADSSASNRPSRAETYVAEPRDVIAVGASTGGPPIFRTFLKTLSANCRLPIVLTQHIAEAHVDDLIQMLDGVGDRKVSAAADGQILEPNHVYVAARGKHLLIKREGQDLRIRLDGGPEENFCRPAVDPMFRSVAEACGRKAIAVVMTGMGSDGANGSVSLKARGAPIIVQDKPSSVVWGMPGAVVQKGTSTFIVPGADIASAVGRLVR